MTVGQRYRAKILASRAAPKDAAPFCREVMCVAKEWARWFYDSKLWQHQREAYKRSVHGICELCGDPGVIVHHRRPLTPKTIHDPKETLAFENLQLVCRACHEQLHEKDRRSDTAPGLCFDAAGESVRRVPPGAGP